MIEKIPEELWQRKDLKILDPCCGNGNFALPVLQKLLKYRTLEQAKKCLYFNDTNLLRLQNVKKYLQVKNISSLDYLQDFSEDKFDLVMANPPYASFTSSGKRASKNHNLITAFIEKALQNTKPGGYILFITPNNITSLSNRNTTISKLTELQIIFMDLNTSKKYFKKIGSSFMWYIVKNEKFKENFPLRCNWKKTEYNEIIVSKV